MYSTGVKKLLPFVLICGCAAPLQQRAYVVGKTSKEAVNATYDVWDKLANARVSSCEEKLPPERHTKSDFDECVGPFNEQTQQLIVTSLEGVQALQLALFVALAQDVSDKEVQKALIDLTLAVKDFIELIQQSR